MQVELDSSSFVASVDHYLEATRVFDVLDAMRPERMTARDRQAEQHAMHQAHAARKTMLANGQALVEALKAGGYPIGFLVEFLSCVESQGPAVAREHWPACRGKLADSQQDATPPKGDDPPMSNAEPESAGMSRQEAAKRLERLCEQGEPFTSQHKLAAHLGCSAGTINKAIRETPTLYSWVSVRQAAPRAQSLNAVVTDCTTQSRELDPADDAAIREFIENADPGTRAWFQALSLEQQLAHLDDPDAHGFDEQPRILDRKP